MEKVYEGTGVCPVCGKKSFRVEMYRYDLPVEGPSIIFVGRCSSCGARTSDVIPLEYGESKELSFELPKDLNKILYLPGGSEVLLPEIGIEMRLTPAFRGRITTVEGILRMIADDVKEETVKEEVLGLAEGRKSGKLIVRDEEGKLKLIEI